MATGKLVPSFFMKGDLLVRRNVRGFPVAWKDWDKCKVATVVRIMCDPRMQIGNGYLQVKCLWQDGILRDHHAELLDHWFEVKIHGLNRV